MQAGEQPGGHGMAGGGDEREAAFAAEVVGLVQSRLAGDAVDLDEIVP